MRYPIRLKQGVLKLANYLLLHDPGPRAATKRAMVYSPNVGGHRHIYSRKIIDALKSLEFQVVFVYCGLQASGKRIFMPMKSPHLAALEEDADVLTVNIGERLTDETDELRLIIELQEEHDIDYTLFIDGDTLIRTFLRQLKPGTPRLLGRNYAVFILSEFFHMGSLKWRQVRNTNKRQFLKKRLFHLHLFNEFNLLDGGLYSDECLVRAVRSDRYVHLPEIGHAPIQPNTDPATIEFFGDVRKRFLEFIAGHPGKDVILCFGDLEARKGFDFLLRLVKENPDLIMVRVGRIKPSYHHTWDTILNREELLFQGRFFEFEHYINDQELMDTLFQSIKYLLLPYQAFYRTSSVMIQALSYSLPVLVSHVGLMRHRVEGNHLGRFFRDNNYDDFVKEFGKLREDYTSYTESIVHYYESEFSPEALRLTLEKTLH